MASRWDVWEWRRRYSAAPFGLGIFNRLNRADTEDDIESGLSIVPSGFAKIRSRSAR